MTQHRRMDEIVKAALKKWPNVPHCWGWLALAHRGDVSGLVGIAILAGCSLVCLLAPMPQYLKRGDKACAPSSLAARASTSGH